jgi:hypothetical protein
MIFHKNLSFVVIVAIFTIYIIQASNRKNLPFVVAEEHDIYDYIKFDT